MPYAGLIHYRWYANGNQGKIPLVLIHGAGGTYLHWPAQVRHLAGENVLALDLPGHGDSKGEGRETIEAYAPSVLEFMDQLNLERAVIAGHSMGSAIALRLSIDTPERVWALILLGAGAKLGVNPALIEYAGRSESYPEAVSLVVRWAFSHRAEARLVELARQRMLALPANVLLSDFKACNNFDLRDRLTEIMQPALILCGEEDQMTPIRFSQYLAANVSDSRLQVVPKAGHMVMQEKPEAVANLIKDFLNELPSG